MHSLDDPFSGNGSKILEVTSPLSAMILKLCDLLPGAFLITSTLVYANSITLSNSTIDEGLPAATEVGLLESSLVANAVKMDSYIDNSAVVLEDGSLWVWGKNQNGQLGNGTSSNINTPFKLEDSGVVDVALGIDFTMYLKSNGSLWALGVNDVGQLGDGTYVSSTVPVEVLTSGVVAIAAGDRHGMIIKDDGSLWATGVNFDGQIGDNSNDNRPSYVQVVASGVAKISAGWAHSMYIGTDGSLWTWGVNDHGGVGDGSTLDRLTPFKVEDSGVIDADGGFQTTYYVKDDGSLWGMGNNDVFQLGDSSTTNRLTPVQIVASGVVDVDAGNTYAVFKKDDGTIWGIGHNFVGRLGTGDEFIETPEDIGMSGVAEFVAYRQTLFLMNDGSVSIIGTNDNSGLGDGDTSGDRDTPYYHFLGGSFTLVSGDGDTDNTSFQIEGYSLLTSSSLPDGSYSVRVQATPASGDPVEAALDITVVDLNSTPEIGGLTLMEGSEDEQLAFSTIGQVSTFAGNGDAGETDGAGEVATFNAPNGLEFDSQGNLFVVDHLNDKIRKIAPDGAVSTFAGNGTPVTVEGNGLNAGFDRPTGIAIDSSDTIYLVEGNGTVVRMVTPSGDAVNIAGKIYEPGFVDGNATDAMFGYPFDVVIDEANNLLYLTDLTNHAIRKVDLNLDPSDSGFVSTVAGNGVAGFADGNGASAQFHEPLCLDIDSVGNLYVTDGQNHRIRKVTPSGEVTTITGTGVSGFLDGDAAAALLNTPRGIVVYDDDTLFVTEYYGHSIREIDLNTNTITRIVGDGTAEDVDGTIDVAKTMNPSALADYDGDLYLVSFDGHTIRKISLPTSLHVYDPDATDTLTVNLVVTNGTLSLTLVGETTISSGQNHSGELSIQGNQEDINATLATLQYTPVADFNGSSSLSYSVTDGSVTSVVENLAITIQSVNDTPVVSASSSISGLEDTPVLIKGAGGTVTTISGSSGVNESGDLQNGPIETALFFEPADMESDSQGNLYVADIENLVIRKITPDGTVSTFAGSGQFGHTDGVGTNAEFSSVWDLAIDSDDNLYVSGAEAPVIRKITPEGVVTTLIGHPEESGAVDGTAELARIDLNYGLDYDATNNFLFIADSGNAVIRKVDLNVPETDPSFVTTLAGTVGQTGYQDGAGDTALFTFLVDLEVDSAGNIYAIDLENAVIRKITPQGVVSTLAGSGEVDFVDGIGAEASFTEIYALEVVDDNTLVVFDAAGALRQVDLITSEVTTLFGDPSSFDGEGDFELIDGEFEVATIAETYGLHSIGNTIYATDILTNSIRKIEIQSMDGMVVEDPDSETVTIELSVPIGVLVVTLEGEVAIPSGENETAEMALHGTLDDVNQTLSTLHYIPEEDFFGQVPISFTVSDGDATSEEQTILVQISNVNDAPVLFSIGNQTTNEDTPISVNVAATDVEEDALSWSLEVSDPALSAIIENNTLTITPQEDWYGTASITVTVSDENGGEASETIEVVVVSQNDPPILAEIGDQSTGKNQPLVLTLSADDVDEDSLQYVSEGSDNLSVSFVENSLTITPATDWTGSESLTIQVLDGNDGVDSETIEVLVSSAPTTTSLKAVTGNYGEPIPILSAGGSIADIVSFSGTGNQGRVDRDALNSEFSNPSSLAIDSEGNFIVADFDNNLIRKVSASGQVSLIAGDGTAETVDGIEEAARFNRPSCVALDAQDNIYVVDHGSHTIRKITPDGVVTTIAGAAGSAGFENGDMDLARLNRPFGLAIDSEAQALYVSEWGNHAIRKILLGSESDPGYVTTLAGSGVPGFSDATGDAAQFNYPYGIVFDAGTIYVADHWNHRIRKVTTSGVVTTIAGNGQEGAGEGPGSEVATGQPFGIAMNGDQLLVSTSTHFLQSIDFANDNAVSILIAEGSVPGLEISTGTVSSIVSVEDMIYMTSLSKHRIWEMEMGSGSIQVNDPEGDELTVNLSVANGVLVIESVIGEVSYQGSETSNLVLQGNVSDLNATLVNLIYYTDSFVGEETLSYTVSDGVSTSDVVTIPILVESLQEF